MAAEPGLRAGGEKGERGGEMREEMSRIWGKKNGSGRQAGDLLGACNGQGNRTNEELN